MTAPLPLSLIVHTRNSAATLPALLDSTSWIPERIVVDMHSEDDTLALCRAAGCRVIGAPVTDGVDAIRNDYLDEATNPWTLMLDSDERLSADAAEAIADLLAEQGGRYDAFGIPRFNTIAGQVMHGSLFYPDHQIRLFRRGHVAWRDGHHHPPEVRGGRLLLLTPPCLHIHHLNYVSLEDFISRQLRYTLSDTYSSDPASFNFADYVGDAYATFAKRHDTASDGDLSTALATILAWDRLMRGLVHWERTGRTTSLGAAFSLPMVVQPSAPAAGRGGLSGRLSIWFARLPTPVKTRVRQLRSRLMGLAGRLRRW